MQDPASELPRIPLLKLFGKSGWLQDRGSESGQMGSKGHQSAASCRQRSPVEGSSAIFQTVSLGTSVNRLCSAASIVLGAHAETRQRSLSQTLPAHTAPIPRR